MSQKFDLKRIEVAIEGVSKSIAQRKVLPRINCNAPQANSENEIIQRDRVAEVNSPEATELVAKINQAIFGTPDAFSLVFNMSGSAGAHMYAKSITIGWGFLQQLKTSPDSQLLIAFSLAHEVSHYLYEYYVRYLGSGRSPHEQPRNCGMIQVNYPTPIRPRSSDFRTWPRRDVEFASSRGSGMTHAEIDAFALVILVKYLGYSTADLSKLNGLFDVLEIPNLPNDTRIADIPDNQLALAVQSTIRRRSFERTIQELLSVQKSQENRRGQTVK